MAADMTVEPWVRLAKLAPPGTDPNELQAAADRYALTADMYAACADLWEEKAMTVDMSPPIIADEPTLTAETIAQDGITVQRSYAVGVIDYSQTQRLAMHSAYMQKAKYFRSKSKPRTALMDGRRDDIYDYDVCDDDVIIPVID